jgi:hypothetical protein
MAHHRLTIFLCGLFAFSAPAISADNPHDLDISVSRTGARFEVRVQFTAPVDVCQAYAFLTNYEDAKNIPGIQSSIVLGRQGNKILVERIAKERILLIPVYLHSILEFTEVSNTRLDFTQTKGDAKTYSGTWSLSPDSKGVRFEHHASFELDTAIPLFIVQYFLENSATKRFEIMAERVSNTKNTLTAGCPARN